MLGNIQSAQYSSNASASSRVSGSEFNRSVSTCAPTSSSGNVSSILSEIRSELKNIDKLLQQLVSQLGGGQGGCGSSGGSANSGASTSGSGQTDTGSVIKGLQSELDSIQNTLSQIGDQQGWGRSYGQNGVYGGQQGGYNPQPSPVAGDGGCARQPAPCPTPDHPRVGHPGGNWNGGQIDCKPPIKHPPVDCPPGKIPVDVPKPPIDTKPPVDCPKPPVVVCPPTQPKPPIDTKPPVVKPPVDCPTTPPVVVCPPVQPKPGCDDKWSVGEVKDGKGEIKLGKDYTINFDESKEEFLVKNNCTGDVTRVWGDPHVDVKNDGKNDWNFKKDSTFQLKDGTKITVGTVNGEGKKASENDHVSYSSKLTITKGDKAIQVTGLAGNHDGKDNVKVTTSGHGRQIDKATDDGVTVKEKKGGWDLNGKTVTQGDVDKAEKGVKAH
ncbi:hypothetical protein GCM10007036_43790 [Alsobacter metallidurans]|uniref:DUF1521 domain-containing protein n=1 Tax=Alsobacter metallidurans TaxID=340221 RepID=A0A917ICW9_9HYPH|nr:DUF1521 domain-containing protein [Alsobacter metallidurans]GGH32137.1 hypothetical protein GCM10007036_43790 [Alsobacter metallidurans]